MIIEFASNIVIKRASNKTDQRHSRGGHQHQRDRSEDIGEPRVGMILHDLFVVADVHNHGDHHAMGEGSSLDSSTSRFRAKAITNSVPSERAPTYP